MKKATELINLIKELINEKDNSKLESLYIKITVEVMSIEYKNIGERFFTDTIIKQYIRLAVKEYIYSFRSLEAEKNLKELIGIIKDFEIL